MNQITDILPMHQGSIAAIDVGDTRIGVALASKAARLPRPYSTLINDAKIWVNLRQIFAQNAVDMVIMGLPQNSSGQDTDQTKKTRKFGQKLEDNLSVTVEWQDEALSSKRAKNELISRGKTFDKAEVDSLAATLILEDYLKEQSIRSI